LAGKLDKEPSVELFGLIDRRSDRGDDDVDHFTVNRQLCAQLLALFIARLRDPLAMQSVGADDLDRIYHSNTEFDPNGQTAEAFKKVLGVTALIFGLASAVGGGKNKYKKMDVLSAFFLVQDLNANPLFRFDTSFCQKIANYIVNTPNIPKQGKSISGRAIHQYYESWRSGLPQSLGIHLDSQRLFDGNQKAEIFARDKGICQICQKEVSEGDAEYDHYPVPHYLGGKTQVDNSRLVCTKCHPRGRPIEAVLDM
jgi:hypothetical protein